VAEYSRRDKANRQLKLGLVWRNRKKISQIIKDYFYLPFLTDCNELSITVAELGC
jgi:hypothetical protein